MDFTNLVNLGVRENSMDHYGWADAIRIEVKRRENDKKRQDINTIKLERIKKHRTTKLIEYPQMKEAFDYVHNLYPSVDVKKANVYHAKKALLNDIGYRGVAGFYDIAHCVIVITDYIRPQHKTQFNIIGEYTVDEVLCHELIHYAANFYLPLSSKEVEEEIAYGKSVNYLRFKKRSDDFIIRKNMMPYLIGLVNQNKIVDTVLTRVYKNNPPNLDKLSPLSRERIVEKLQKEMFEETARQAYEMGERIIAVYTNLDPTGLYERKPKDLIIEDPL
jgi:hypothetical protein